MNIGETKTFNYTGGVQSIELLPGTYKLECYGAQGTGILSGSGGNGGYAVGEIDLYKQTQVFIVVGGTDCYNGGATNGSGNGGGATHIATQTGVLSSLVNNKDSVLIVAGGGGGGERVRGGHGGGLTGGTQGSTYSGHSRTAGGGTQTSGGIAGYNTNSSSSATNGSFGQGGSGNGSDNGPGGGGGWYGGGGVNYAGGAGGGSSYIAKLQNASTTTGANTGNGYAKITCLKLGKCKIQVVNQDGIHGLVNGEEIVEVKCGENVTLSVTDNLEKAKFLIWKDDDKTYGKYQANIIVQASGNWVNTIHKMYCCCIPIPDRRNDDFYKDSHDQYVYDADRLKRVIGV